MRLFVAVPLPDALAELLDAATPRVPGLRSAATEQLHVTVHFLGEVEEGDLEALRAALAAACGSIPAYELAFEAIAPAPPRRPRMLWARAGDSPHHAALVAAVANASAPHAPAARPPHPGNPHVTMARQRGRGRLRRWPEPVPLAGATLTVTACALVHSQLGRAGARHTTLARLPLGQASGRR